MPRRRCIARLEGDAGERRAVARARVAETDIVEAQHAGGDDEIPGARRVLDVKFGVEQLEQPGAAGRGARELGAPASAEWS